MENFEKEVENAIASNDVDTVRELFQTSKEIKTLTSSKKVDMFNKSLSKSVQFGHLDMIKLLLTLGADVNHEDPIKQSVLHQTIFSTGSDMEEIIMVLIRSGANINHQTTSGESCFMCLIRNGVLAYKHLIDLVDSVQNVYETFSVTGGSYLHMLKERYYDDDRISLKDKFLKRGVQINGKDYNDDTPLHLMATIACCSSMRFLIETGADIHARNRLGETVLHSLASSNHYNGFSESLMFLTEEGDDINETDYLGRTALHHALFSKQTTTEAIKEFIKYGIKINMSDIEGKNEMFRAVEDFDQGIDSLEDLETRAEVITLLAEVGVDVNKGDNFGVTPLHQVMKSGWITLISAVIDCDADVTKRTQTGATPLHWACKRYRIASLMTKLYVRNNYDINVKDNFGSTSLHWAVWYRELSAIQILVENGCNVNIKDNKGNTPADLAKKVHFREFCDFVTSPEKFDLEKIKDSVNTCSGVDTFYACPHLKYIQTVDKGLLNFEAYLEHTIFHKASIRKCIMASLHLEDTGLYHNIKENEDVPKLIKKLMYTLADKVSKRNELLKCEVQLRGSSNEGTKVGLPDEFDYLWKLCVQ